MSQIYYLCFGDLRFDQCEVSVSLSESVSVSLFSALSLSQFVCLCLAVCQSLPFSCDFVVVCLFVFGVFVLPVTEVRAFACVEDIYVKPL